MLPPLLCRRHPALFLGVTGTYSTVVYYPLYLVDQFMVTLDFLTQRYLPHTHEVTCDRIHMYTVFQIDVAYTDSLEFSQVDYSVLEKFLDDLMTQRQKQEKKNKRKKNQVDSCELDVIIGLRPRTGSAPTNSYMYLTIFIGTFELELTSVRYPFTDLL